VHLESREDEERRSTRVIVWSDSTTTDLGALVFASVSMAALGALLGTDTYMIGLPGLLTGPLVLAAVVALLRAGPRYARPATTRPQALEDVRHQRKPNRPSRRQAVSRKRTPVLAWQRYPNGFFARNCWHLREEVVEPRASNARRLG
jgi:hypothetical protein